MLVVGRIKINVAWDSDPAVIKYDGILYNCSCVVLARYIIAESAAHKAHRTNRLHGSVFLARFVLIKVWLDSQD
jgi:hypothetical protein